MRSLSSTAGLVIAGILALALVVYVFAGGSRAHADRAPHCTSQQALGEVKAELFRRAGAVRGTTDPIFDAVARDSVVLAGSRMVRRHHAGSDTVTCTGTLLVDLPPGATAAGAQHSLTANVGYDLGPDSGGSPRLLGLSNAEPLVSRLATVSRNAAPQEATIAASRANEALAEMPPPAAPAKAAPTSPSPQAAPAPASKTPAAPHQAPRTIARPTPAPPPQPKQPPPAKAAPVRKDEPSVTRPRDAAAKPSFDCGKARARSEIAVCSNPGLAALDREMSREFFRALRAADPDEADALRASRTHFLHYRNSCGSDACIADAYRGHMAEIADIMGGR
jgi:hypothetical protein